MENNEMIDVSVVILSHNRKEMLKLNLEVLLSNLNFDQELEVIFVDNNSNDGTVEELQKIKLLYPNLVHQLNKENLGVAGGRNTGFRLAKRKYILALDDDSVIKIQDIRKLPSYFEENSKIGLLALESGNKDINCENTVFPRFIN